MALRGYFYRTWYPGMNEENGVVNLDKVYQCSRRLARLKKCTLWTMILAFIALLLTVLIYNSIPRNDSNDELHHHHDKPVEVPSPTFAPITDGATLEQTTSASNSSYSGKSCALDQVQCKSTGHCLPISAYCNGNYDCGQNDVSDETGCTCRQRLKFNSPNKICDSIITCADRGDELNCPCQKSSFNCNNNVTNTKECVIPEMVCDGVRDCLNGFDETECIGISSSLLRLESGITPKGVEGYVLVRTKGTWHLYCSNDWSKEMGIKICQHVGYRKLLNLETVELDDFNQKRESDPRNNTGLLKNIGDRVNIIVAQELEVSDKRTLNAQESRHIGRKSTEMLCRIGYLKCYFGN